MIGFEARAFVPRIVLAVLFGAGAIYAYVESVYLRDQAQAFGLPRISEWMWAFRFVSVLLLAAMAVVVARR